MFLLEYFHEDSKSFQNKNNNNIKDKKDDKNNSQAFFKAFSFLLFEIEPLISKFIYLGLNIDSDLFNESKIA